MGLEDAKRLALPGTIPLKEAKLLENRFVKGMTLAESARDAGYGTMTSTKNSLAVSAHGVIKRHKDMNSELLQSFARQGINPDTLTRKIMQGMNADMKVKRKVGKDLEVFETVPDQMARHKFVQTAVNIMGGEAPKKVDVEVKSFEQRLMEITLRGE